MKMHDSIVHMLPEKVNGNPQLVWRGRHLTTSFMLRVGERGYVISVHQGRIISVETAVRVMPEWTFCLAADEETWQAFWQAVPQPGFHDLMALLKFRRLTISGTLHPFMSNLLYFKQAFASIRPSATGGKQ